MFISRDVSDVTKAPEMLGGRVKTLHPAVHAGNGFVILYFFLQKNRKLDNYYHGVVLSSTLIHKGICFMVTLKSCLMVLLLKIT